MQPFDDALLRAAILAGPPGSPIGAAARWLTELGGSLWLVPLTLAVAGWLALRGHRRHAASLLLVTLSGRAVVELIKWATDRARPELIPRVVDTHSLSFPSGHAANSMLVYMTLALVVGPLVTRTSWLVAFASLLSLTIGLTRPILGVHWPTDVIAGWIFGLVWTLFFVRLLRPWVEGRPRSRPSLL